MTTSDLDRRLTGLLRERAQEAMERTSTQEQLSSLLATPGLGGRQPGRRWVAAGALAAAAATVAVTAGMPNGEGDRMPSGDVDSAEPAPAPANVETVQLASTFLEAVYSHDADRAASFLSPYVQIGRPGAAGMVPESEWRDEIAWYAAIGATMVDHTCQAGETSTTTSEVSCTYSMHALGSDQLRRRPYGDNTLDVTIRDGLIVALEDEWHYLENGFSAEMWEPFAAWIVREHPSDVRVMYTSSYQNLPRLTPTSLRRWEQRIAEWLAAQP